MELRQGRRHKPTARACRTAREAPLLLYERACDGDLRSPGRGTDDWGGGAGGIGANQGEKAARSFDPEGVPGGIGRDGFGFLISPGGEEVDGDDGRGF